MMDDAILAGAKVLLLEDEFLINLSTSEMIQEMGCIVRAFMHLDEARKGIETDLPDLAVLDVNIAGVTNYNFADALNQRHVPIVFLTGYDSVATQGQWRGYPVCRKPCLAEDLKNVMTKALRTGRDIRL
jgi:CheY-like chemotaxis protein